MRENAMHKQSKQASKQARFFMGWVSGKSEGDNAFTLIELLVVIAILGVLATAVVLVLNPAELIKQGRDSTRLSDLAALNSALGLVVADNPSISLGSSSVVYTSLPDTSPTCGSWSLPTLPPSWSYHCATSQNVAHTDGSGWIPVNFAQFSSGSPLSKLPIDPINATSTNNYYEFMTDGTTYELQIVSLESQRYIGEYPSGVQAGSNLALAPYVFPTNWVQVPGNGTFGTSNFWVMKYDAKCVQGTTPLTSPDSGYHTYYDSSAPCTSGNGKYVASTPDGYPIAYISHTTALSYCASLGAHLLTNDEYMTIATNAANQPSNWSGGSVGSGYLYSGHNDNAPAYALTASPDDSNGYYGETNTGGNQRRTLTLSNGSVVWDMAGNVWEHVQRSVNNVGDNTASMSLPACSNGTAGWEWCQYGTALTPYVSAWTSDVQQSLVAPPNSSWNSNQGVGQVYTYGAGGNQGTAVFIRGAYWYYGSFAGAFALNMSWGPSNTYYNVGIRCAR